MQVNVEEVVVVGDVGTSLRLERINDLFLFLLLAQSTGEVVARKNNTRSSIVAR